MAEKGLTFTEIQVLMGHSGPESTRKYVHCYTPNLVETIAKLDLPGGEKTVERLRKWYPNGVHRG